MLYNILAIVGAVWLIGLYLAAGLIVAGNLFGWAKRFKLLTLPIWPVLPVAHFIVLMTVGLKDYILDQLD